MRHRLGLRLRQGLRLERLSGGMSSTNRPRDPRSYRRSRPTLPTLTPRERSVLELLASGRGYADIASSLKIELNTVRTHVRSIYEKLAVQNRAEAVNVGWTLGLLRRPTS